MGPSAETLLAFARLCESEADNLEFAAGIFEGKGMAALRDQMLEEAEHRLDLAGQASARARFAAIEWGYETAAGWIPFDRPPSVEDEAAIAEDDAVLCDGCGNAEVACLCDDVADAAEVD